MSSAFERRAERMRGTANDLLRESKHVIWCYEPEQMPALIDLLVARGELSESDRARCVHRTTLERAGPMSREEAAKVVDADEMLDAAGIRTATAEAWDAYLQGAEAMKAFWRNRFGELDADDLEMIEQLERDPKTLKLRELARAPSQQPDACISPCK
jgi:hypothetical protein